LRKFIKKGEVPFGIKADDNAVNGINQIEVFSLTALARSKHG